MNIDAMELLKHLNSLMDDCKTQGEMKAVMSTVMWVEDKMDEYDKKLDAQFNSVEV